MTAPKAKTLQARFGFSDPELTTPKHDQIMLWLDANIDQVLADVFKPEYSVATCAVDDWKMGYWYKKSSYDEHFTVYFNKESLTKAYQHYSQELETDQAKLSRIKPVGEVWQIGRAREKIEEYGASADLVANLEQAISKDKARFEKETNDATQNIEKTKGKISALRSFASTTLEQPLEWACKSISKVWEKPILSNNYKSTYTIGFVDMVVRYSTPSHIARYNTKTESVDFVVEQSDAQELTAYFEVKPSVPSLGEVIRQVRMYQTHTGDASWFIVSPDDRFAEQLRDQGIGFVKVPNTL